MLCWNPPAGKPVLRNHITCVHNLMVQCSHACAKNKNTQKASWTGACMPHVTTETSLSALLFLCSKMSSAGVVGKCVLNLQTVTFRFLAVCFLRSPLFSSCLSVAICCEWCDPKPSLFCSNMGSSSPLVFLEITHFGESFKLAFRHALTLNGSCCNSVINQEVEVRTKDLTRKPKATVLTNVDREVERSYKKQISWLLVSWGENRCLKAAN